MIEDRPAIYYSRGIVIIHPLRNRCKSQGGIAVDDTKRFLGGAVYTGGADLINTILVIRKLGAALCGWSNSRDDELTRK